MATAATPSTPNPSSAAAYDQFVDARIAKTRTAVKSADLATGVVVLLVWLLVVLLIAAVADHWLVAGGLDPWERYALFGVGLAGAALYFATRLGPNLLRRVNPLYAAREIERETPELKNSLLNLLQLRGAVDSPAIKSALERQAAERLAQAGDAPIDHTPLVRAAKLLLALVALVGVYVVASPKDFFASAGRVLAPWSPIAAPSRVRITAIEPGATTLAQGERLNVSAMVSGLRDDELVELVYTTDDRQVVGRRVPMTASRGGLQFTGALPAGSGAAAALGVQGSLTYRLEAGDAHSPNYRVEVLTAATIAPVSVRYDYPTYTGYESREVEGVGDLRGVAGTRVTLSVEANLPIEAAQIDIGADGRPDVRMTPDGNRATGAFALRLDGEGANTTTSYVLKFTSPDGQANHNPPQYQIEVLADLAPEASIVEPEAPSLDVGLRERVRIVVEALDPDFTLGRVRLIGEAAGRRVLERDLLRGDGRGRFRRETELTPAEVSLRPGDVLDYWIEAADNRTPQPNVTLSERRQLRVLADRNAEQGNNGDGQPGAGGRPQENGPQEKGRQENGPGENGAGGEPNQPPRGEQGGPQQDQKQDQQGGQPGESGNNAAPQNNAQPENNDRPQEDNAGEQGDQGNSPPPGGITGPGKEGQQNSAEDNNPGSGTEGAGSSEPNDGADSAAGGSQAGNRDGQQPQPPGGQQNQSGEQDGAQGDPQASGSEGAGEGGGNEDAQPVSRDGSDDGSAFDRIREWLNNNQKSGESQGQRQDSQQRSPDERDIDQRSGDGDKSEGGENAGDAQQQRGDETPRQSSAEEDGAERQPDGSNPTESEDLKGDSNGREGERGQAGRGSEANKDSRTGSGSESPDRSPDDLGAGERDRSGEQSSSKSSESGGDAPPGEASKRDAGPREGTDGAGQNQAADRGAGQSSDRGAGDASGRDGGEQPSDSPTGGESGDERGEGSRSRPTDDGGSDGPGDQQPPGQSGKPSDQGEGESEATPGEEGSDSGAGKPGSDRSNSIDDRRGEGARDSERPGELGGPMELGDRGATSDAAGEGAESGGDAANLEYAKKQTELVLKRLEEQLQKKEVDRKLLDKLGWTEEDLRRFVDRWQSRRQKAAQRGAEGEAELDRALRSLGLSPEGPSITRQLNDDSLRDLRENARTKTPPRLRDPVEWYLRSLNAADERSAE